MGDLGKGSPNLRDEVSSEVFHDGEGGENAVRKAVKKGITEVAVGKAVSQGIACPAIKKPSGKSAAAVDVLSGKTA